MYIIFREYGRVVWQRKWAFFLVLISLISVTALDTLVPIFYKGIANTLSQSFSDENYQQLISYFTYIALCYLCIWLLWRVVEFGIIPLEAGGMRELDKYCFRIIAQQKYGYFENSFSGGLIKKAGRFVSAYEGIIDWLLFHFLQNIVAITVAFIIFYQSQTDFALYFLIWVVIFLSWSIGFSIWKLRFDKAVAEWNSNLGSVYSDAISHIFTVKSFVLEKSEQAIIDQTADTTFQKRKVAWILMFVSFAVQGALSMGLELVLIYLMIQKWEAGTFNVGEFVLFQSVLILLIHRLWDFGRYFRNFFNAIADATEMADIFASQEIEADHPQAEAHPITKGNIEYRQIDFSYINKQPLFKQFSLTIQAGEKVALVGASGSGKTSLTKLLFRFTEPQQGAVYFDGIDAKNFTLASLRQQISLVPQQPELFHRSIKENILLGKALSTEQLKEVMQQAQCLDFVEALPKHWDTLVGERGVKLSGGEKQRIAIARAFLEDAPIVVLDEATSALDSMTEKHIQQAIFKLIEHKTAIVIAHRLSTILQMDRIIVLDQGRIIEQGQHHELLEKKGLYYQMWQHQSGEFLS
ncbi:MAG: ABC transporter ATP-binding protein [bacterium]